MPSTIIEFPADTDIQEAIPTGTELVIRPATDRDGIFAVREGQSQPAPGRPSRPWVRIPFRVEGGAFDGRFCSFIFTVDPGSKRFKAIIESLTGRDLASGARMSWPDDLVTAVRASRYRATVETRGGFDNVVRILAREDGDPVGDQAVVETRQGEERILRPVGTPATEGDFPF